MEVMIAMAIFFMTVFAILELVATNLRNARLLETPRVDCGLMIADLIQTNQLEESDEDMDFGKLYPGYHARQRVVPADDIILNGDTNGLFHVEYILTHPDGTVETNLEGLMWKPDSKPVHSP
jgi:Tfp pilus assembly protein PilV